MPITVQRKRRRGTTAQHASFTGAEAELTVDLTKHCVVAHDGITAGGWPQATEAYVNNAVAAVPSSLAASLFFLSNCT